MKEKKTEVITFRTTEKVKEKLEQLGIVIQHLPRADKQKKI